MVDVLRPILELFAVIPGAYLSYIPMKEYLKYPYKPFVCAALSILSLLCVVVGILAYNFNMTTTLPVFGLIVIAMIGYCRSFKVSPWKTVSVALAIVAVYACINSIARAINAGFIENTVGLESDKWFCPEVGIIYNACCWLVVLFTYYPAATAAKEMIEDDHFAQTWYVFWILPILFIALNVFMVPEEQSILYTGRLLEMYFIFGLSLLILLLTFCGLFLMMANYLNRNARLQYENHLLSMQQEKYDNLCAAIEDAKMARHDMRHHFNQLAALAEAGDLARIKTYLSTAIGRIPVFEQSFCENRAVDSMLSHYYTLAQQADIPIQIAVDLPKVLPVDEMDFCLVLANIMENAMEASLKTEQTKRGINVDICNHLNRIVLIRVENTYSFEIQEKNGVYQSTKRKGRGLGIQSVRQLSEKNGGTSDFSYENGIFVAKIMLRGNHMEER